MPQICSGGESRREKKTANNRVEKEKTKKKSRVERKMFYDVQSQLSKFIILCVFPERKQFSCWKREKKNRRKNNKIVAICNVEHDRETKRKCSSVNNLEKSSSQPKFAHIKQFNLLTPRETEFITQNNNFIMLEVLDFLAESFKTSDI